MPVETRCLNINPTKRNNLVPLWLHILIGLFAINTIAVIVMENRRPTDTLAWVLLLLFVPVFGLVLYFLVGTRPGKHTLIQQTDLQQLKSYIAPASVAPTPAEEPLASLLLTNNGALLTNDNHLRLYTTFREMIEQLMRDIANAKHHIHFQFFKFEDDAIGRQISDLLIQKASAGVEVRVIYDAAANWSVPVSFYRRLRKGGVEVEPFNKIFPYLSSFSNYRNHRKVVVIDAQIGYMGGMNIAERYLTGIRTGIWRDTHFRITGSAVAELQIAFVSDWHFATHLLLNSPHYFRDLKEEKNATDFPPSSLAESYTVETPLIKQSPAEENNPYTDIPTPTNTTQGVKVQIVTSNPTDPWRVMNQALPLLISQAQRYVWLQSPYFIPTDAILNVMCTMALAGKDVRLMIPAKSDRGILVPKATFSYLDRILSAGVKVYLYDAGYMHAKTVVVDDRIASIGSVNIDPRSISLSFEINAFIYDATIACQQRRLFEQDIQSAHLLNLTTWRQRSFLQRSAESFARILAPMF